MDLWESIPNWLLSEGWWRLIEHMIVLVVLYRVFRSILSIESRGKLGLVSYITKFALRISAKLGFIRNKKEDYLEKQSLRNVEQILCKKEIRLIYQRIPEKGINSEELLGILDSRVKADIDPTQGYTFAYVYEHSKAHTQVTEDCFVKFMHSNALNPILFNSIRVIENEVIRMCSNLFHGDSNCVGNITSCGTESLLLAMKTYRDYRGTGEVIMCTSGHPAVNKGCHYVGLRPTQIPYDQQKRMSVAHLRKAISSSTILVVCSAPQYPHGVVDNVVEIAEICKQYGVPLHVDSAIGGFILPFIEMEGNHKFGPWDFRVDGVTSINADLHKYGFAPKGSSALIYNSSAIRKHQYFSFSTWPGGIYISPTAMGTRNGGCFSAAWGSLLDLGVEGFRKSAKLMLQSVAKFVAYLKSEPQLELLAEPDATIVSFRCKSFSCYKLADAMEKRGFFVQKQSNPESIHMTFMPSHNPRIDQIIQVLSDSLAEIKGNPKLYESGSKAVYGMMASIPDEAIVEEFVVHYMDQVYKVK